MGRHKPGKPRRPRHGAPTSRGAEPSLRELQPPGAIYEEWVHVPQDMDPSAALADDRLDDDARDLMARMARLGPLYGYEVPVAAFLIDQAMDTGKLGLIVGDNQARLLTLEECAARFGSAGTATEADVRISVHSLHAAGVLLVEEHEDTPLLRVVAGRPDTPGDPWIFQDSPESASVPGVCIPAGAGDQLGADELMALMYLRSCRSQSREPDLQEYLQLGAVDGPDQARRLFETVAATGLVDYRGCEACPAGHLCSREGR
ncbi:hypothetical protein [Streptomyces umbrinus]|uniref:hypothetical protein n=1 Tax=Streptomyces umbrinus TaxID=67370 RepID=UPI0033FFF3E3